MTNPNLRSVRAEIDLACIDHNVKEIKKLVGTTPIIGIVKADAYGHGAIETAQVLLDNQVEYLGVATLAEAIELRESNIAKPIIILGPAPPEGYGVLLDYNFIPVISTLKEASLLSSLAVGKAKAIEVLIALETGMGRIGFFPSQENFQDILKINMLPNIRVKGLFSHLATADEKDKTYSYQQIELFNHLTSIVSELGVTTCFRTLANSAAVMEIPESHYDAVRPGIILYGSYPSTEVDRNIINLKPAMSLKANICFLKTVPPGTSISYGRKFTTNKESIIATLPLGYADGYPRFLSGKGRVLIKGQFAPLVGNICMDQCMVDVSHIPDVQIGDEVVLMGHQGENVILADEIAEKTGTINYEILCRIGKRVPRIYINKD